MADLSSESPSLVSQAFSLAWIVSPVLPYVPQYLQVQKTRNPEGFSTYVSLILLVSNILRIVFWYGKRFDEAVLMVACQAALVELCVRCTPTKGEKPKTIYDMNLADFWLWDSFESHATFLVGFSSVFGFLGVWFANVSWWVELLGSLSMGIEATLGVPQFYKNYKKQSTAGLSPVLIMCWLAGDSIKAVVFVSTGAPMQFIACSFAQISVDIAILAQIYTYSRKEHQKL